MSENGVQDKILRRCRAGDADALRAVAYQLADELYTLALTALDNEVLARAAVIETWRRLLASLGRWRFDRDLPTEAESVLGRVMARIADPQQVRQAMAGIASRREQEELSAAPPDLVEYLVAAGDRMSPVLAGAAGRRRGARRVALALSIVAVAVLVGISSALYHGALNRRSPQLQFEMLQQRIAQMELPAAVQEAYLSLLDPEDAQAVQAEAYQRLGLVLEEITNARSLYETGHLRFVKERIAAQGLIEIVRHAAEDAAGPRREKLMSVMLVLEEAVNL